MTTQELMLVKEAVSSTALEKGWDKEYEEKMFHETVAEIIKAQVKVTKKKRHKQ